jgi:predicted dehydrogenase
VTEFAIGQIGVGFGQAVHVPAFRRDARARVVALCASTPEKGRAVAAQLGVPRAIDSWSELVADRAIDVVSIAVPPTLQCEIARLAVRNGKHVFLEKPVGTSAGEVEALVALVEGQRVCAVVDFLFGRVPVFEQAAAAISAGAIGDVTRLAVTWRTRTYAHRNSIESWKRHSSSGGGVLNSHAAHAFQYLEQLVGRLSSLDVTPRSAAEVDDRLLVRAALPSGASATISIDVDADGPPQHRIEIEGSSGSLILENLSTDTVGGFVLTDPSRPRRTIDRSGDGDRIVPAALLASELLDAIEHADPRSTNLRDGLRVQELLDATREGRRTGRTVKV